MRILSPAIAVSVGVLVLLGRAMGRELDLGMEFRLTSRTLTNLQTFTQALGGAVAPPITDSGQAARPFEVSGSTFPDFPSAGTRSCNNQHNSCADIANNKTAAITVGQCDTQQTACLAAQSSATQTNFQVLVSQDANFDYICDS